MHTIDEHTHAEVAAKISLLGRVEQDDSPIVSLARFGQIEIIVIDCAI